MIDTLNEILGAHMFPKIADGGDPRVCPTCGVGQLSLKLGRFGAFIGCSNYPECRFTRKLDAANGEGGDGEPKLLGTDPQTEEQITLRSGRFGPYVQRGEGDKPARSGVPKGTPMDSVDLELALKLLALPREVGIHPETHQPITANFGRYGPFIASNGQYASLDSPEEVFTVGINRAVSLLAEKKSKGPRRQAAALKELGAHPQSGAPVKVMNGRYGPYVRRRHDQCHAAQRHRSAKRDPRTGGGIACGARSQRRRQAQAQNRAEKVQAVCSKQAGGESHNHRQNQSQTQTQAQAAGESGRLICRAITKSALLNL